MLGGAALAPKVVVPRLHPRGGNARARPTIYLAGQLGMTPDGKFAGAPGDFRAQATQVFENLKLGLAAVGANFEHVVRLTVFFTDIANLPTYFEVRDRYVNTKAPPSSTAVQISKLARDAAVFEVEAIAVVPEG
jgi:enamine deaminase RidA (YjgF/YER057c/UK114 family)